MFGITLTTEEDWPSQFSIDSSFTPAATDNINLFSTFIFSEISFTTFCINCGFTAKIMTSVFFAASQLTSRTLIPYFSAISCCCALSGSAAINC